MMRDHDRLTERSVNAHDSHARPRIGSERGSEWIGSDVLALSHVVPGLRAGANTASESNREVVEAA